MPGLNIKLSDWKSRMVPIGISGPTFQVDDVPEHFHEHYILTGYRHPKSTVKQCILSVFDATNETLNFWTHFLPSWYFLYVLKNLSESLDFKQDSFTWPLLCYMFVCCIFPLTSASAHTFNTMSDRARFVCFFLDYGALSLFSLGAAMAYKAYCFPVVLKNTWYGEYFIHGAVVNAIMCTVISCQTRFMKPSIPRTALRLGAFAGPYIYDIVPILYRLIICGDTANFLHIRQFIFASLAVFLYASRFPERLQPGVFDIIGHSHQLFHVMSIFGTMDQMHAILQDMKERKEEMTINWEFSSLWSSIGLVSVIMVINSCIIMLYSLRLSKLLKTNHAKCS